MAIMPVCTLPNQYPFDAVMPREHLNPAAGLGDGQPSDAPLIRCAARLVCVRFDAEREVGHCGLTIFPGEYGEAFAKRVEPH